MWFITGAFAADESLSRRFHMIKPRQVDVVFSVCFAGYLKIMCHIILPVFL